MQSQRLPIYAKMIEAIVSKFVATNDVFREFLDVKQITVAELVNRVMMCTSYRQATGLAPKNKKQTLTLEQAHAIVARKHDYRWIGDRQHCIIFLFSGDRPHTFCSGTAIGEIVCPSCSAKPENAEIVKAYQPIKATLDLEHHRLHFEQLSLEAARSKLRAGNESVRKLRTSSTRNQIESLISYAPLRDHAYYAPLGLVVKQVIERGRNVYQTVGIDSHRNGQIRAITMRELEQLLGFEADIAFSLKSLDTEAYRYATRNNVRLCAM